MFYLGHFRLSLSPILPGWYVWAHCSATARGQVHTMYCWAGIRTSVMLSDINHRHPSSSCCAHGSHACIPPMHAPIRPCIRPPCIQKATPSRGHAAEAGPSSRGDTEAAAGPWRSPRSKTKKAPEFNWKLIQWKEGGKRDYALRRALVHEQFTAVFRAVNDDYDAAVEFFQAGEEKDGTEW